LPASDDVKPLANRFLVLKQPLLTQDSPNKLKLVLLELSGNEDFQHVIKIAYHVRAQNSSAKHPVTPFSAAWGGGRAA
jgi:hypothetical protein